MHRKKTGAPAVGSGAAAAKSKQPPADKSQRVLMALHDKLKATGAVNEKVRDTMSVDCEGAPTTKMQNWRCWVASVWSHPK